MGMITSHKEDKKIIIWPLALWYIIVVLIIGGGFVLLMNIGPILIVMFENEPLEIFGHAFHNSWLLVFSIPIALILDYLYFKAILWKVSFTKTHIYVPKIPEIQEKAEILCAEILTCEVTMKGFYYFFTFTSSNGKKKKIFITRFSFKQLESILIMIQERGGLIDQNINDILNPLRIRNKT